MDDPTRQIVETPLPGVGVRYEFTIEDGRRLNVVVHRDGRREIFVQSTDDPDASWLMLSLDEGDSRTMAELLGGSQVVRSVEALQLHGLTPEWLDVGEGSPAGGRTIGELELRSKTGVTVVGVLRGDHAFPTPGPEFKLEAGDTVIVFGTPESVTSFRDLLANG